MLNYVRNLYYENTYIMDGVKLTVVLDNYITITEDSDDVIYTLNIMRDGSVFYTKNHSDYLPLDRHAINMLDIYYKILPKVIEDFEEYESNFEVVDGEFVHI